jgi:CelD/BcsL family acetyltransferase involved in cellulose biosynthesis
MVGLSAVSQSDRASWRELLADHPQSAPFVEEEWVDAWSKSFGPREPLLVCNWERDRLIGLGAFQRLRESWNGRAIEVLQSLTNPESPRFEFLSRAGRLDVQERMWRELLESGGADVLRVEHLPEHSPTLDAGLSVANEQGWSHVIEESFASPWRALPNPSAAWDEGLSRKFKSNLRNRQRRLEQLGAVAFDVVKSGSRQRAALNQFYELEASGWKGERGTAIGSRANARAFYDGLLERTARDLWITILSVAGRAAAAQLIRVNRRSIFLLKTAYDPEFAHCAPGQLITARLIRYGAEHSMELLDFLGENMEWKSDWEPSLRAHYRVMLFSPGAGGRYAYWTRYGVKENVKRIPGALRAVRWLRSSLPRT